ncbi:hypothetical protein [Pseudenhygromyxa sp. WMMC2535]|uniref:hypothetical protein n=1 Tax=Pseudenhygromyxa sp. WMMC2535 TaxID=2712867 RepID=UPI0020D0BED5|nr:hypothetical protein [Pseudenhygromyxa sp. WMMC2535]
MRRFEHPERRRGRGQRGRERLEHGRQYPDTLLHRPEFGDALLEEDGQAIANYTGCEGFEVGATGPAPFVSALIQAGSEGKTMPIGLPAHAAETVEAREALLGSSDPAAIEALAAAGAVTLVAHTEDWSVEELVELPLDGFEMYNLHANLFLNIVEAGILLTKIGYPETLPHSDLILLALISEDPIYLDTWSAVLATGVHKLTTVGTDCHRNTFPDALPDGQRVDSYERMMKWFSNHLLVAAEALEDPDRLEPAALDEALAAGRLYGAFEVFGAPIGFDFHAELGDQVFEIGGAPSLTDGAVSLEVSAPTIQDRDPSTAAPTVELRLLRASAEGWEELATSSGPEGAVPTLSYLATDPGAYRAEVRILPRHLAGLLGDYEDLIDESFVWIYATRSTSNSDPRRPPRPRAVRCSRRWPSRTRSSPEPSPATRVRCCSPSISRRPRCSPRPGWACSRSTSCPPWR